MNARRAMCHARRAKMRPGDLVLGGRNVAQSLSDQFAA